MPDLPPELYVPAFGFLVMLLSVAGTAIKVLWNRYIQVADKLHEVERVTIAEDVRVIALNSEALRSNTDEFKGLAAYVRKAIARRTPSSGRQGEG